MTQREQTANKPLESRAGIYDNPRSAKSTGSDLAYTNDLIARATDQVRWGPILAGLFTALTTLLGLSVLGLAIGLSTFNPNDPLGNFGIGAGIWGAISALIAFGIGGYMAGGTSRVRGSDSGMLNGALVWIVAIPLLLYLVGSGIGTLLGTAGAVVGAAVPAVAPVAGEAANDPALQATAQAAATALQATAEAVQGSVSDQDVSNAAEAAGRTTWGTLLWLGLGAAAAVGGGYAGGRTMSSSRQTAEPA
jgi:hypothetical protein